MSQVLAARRQLAAILEAQDKFDAAEARLYWADLREDEIIDAASGFWSIFGPPGPPGGSGSTGNGPGSKNCAGCTEDQTRRPIISPIRGYLVFGWTDRKKIKQ